MVKVWMNSWLLQLVVVATDLESPPPHLVQQDLVIFQLSQLQGYPCLPIPLQLLRGEFPFPLHLPLPSQGEQEHSQP